MQLKVRRNQRSGLLGKPVFTLDVIADLSEEERKLVDRYKLWPEIVYSSDAATANADRVHAGDVSALGAVIADKAFKRFLTIKNLVNGEHIECRDLGELLAAEQQIRIACTNLRRYLDVAESFDGREEVVDIIATEAA